MKIRPPIIALFYLLVSLALHYLYPNQKIIFYPSNLLGIVLIGLGVFLIGWAKTTFKKKGTTYQPFEKPKKIISTGPFTFSRNPMYLALTIILLGISFLVGSIPFFLPPLAFFLTINNVNIPREEKLMTKLFGKKYIKYKQQVRRWI